MVGLNQPPRFQLLWVELEELLLLEKLPDSSLLMMTSMKFSSWASSEEVSRAASVSAAPSAPAAARVPATSGARKSRSAWTA